MMFSNCLQIRLWEGVSGEHREGTRCQAGAPDCQPASHKALLLLCICLTHAHTSLGNTMNFSELYKFHQISRLEQAVETRVYNSNTTSKSQGFPNQTPHPLSRVWHVVQAYAHCSHSGNQAMRAPSGQASIPSKVGNREMLHHTLTLKASLPIFLTNASHLALPYLQESHRSETLWHARKEDDSNICDSTYNLHNDCVT